jgi:hypothetical protein
MRNIVEKISACPDVRAIVLSSTLDKYWTAGLDSELFMACTPQTILGTGITLELLHDACSRKVSRVCIA